MAMCTVVKYAPCDTSLRKQTGNIITFETFEEGNILTKPCYNEKSVGEYDDNSNMPPLLCKEEMVVMYYGDESDQYFVFYRDDRRHS